MFLEDRIPGSQAKLLMVYISFICVSCSGNDPDNNENVDGGLDIDGGSGDGDTDTDGDADGDGDGDSDSDTDSDDFDSCTETTATADKENGKTNLILAVDTSGSMNKETEMVQDNINNRFADKFGAQTDIDVHIILLSKSLKDPSSSGDGMCVSSPLGSGNCPDDSNPQELFWHIPETISSSNSLKKIIECWGDNGDDCDGERWQEYASPGGFVHFVVVSDDDSKLTADEFTTWADSLFGDDYMFHGIVAKTDGSGDNITPECDEYAADEGAVYKELITETGGVFGDLCLQENNEFDAVFNDIITEVITNVKMPCEWFIPEPPDGDELDPSKVNVVFEDGTTSLEIGKVDSLSDCSSVEHGWYYDDNNNPTKISVCPQTCDWIQGRPDAEMIIKFGCKTEQAGPI